MKTRLPKTLLNISNFIYRHLDETSIVKMSEVFPVVETTNRDNTTAFDCDYCYTLILNERIMAQVSKQIKVHHVHVNFDLMYDKI